MAAPTGRRAQPWTELEVEAIISDHFAMLTKELGGRSYSKTAHRRALSPLLDGRSDGSIERKHQNISAVLIELGYPYISGYKPLPNVQRLLAEAVAARVVRDRRLGETVRKSVEADAATPAVTDILARLVEPPRPAETPGYGAVRERETPRRAVQAPVNYLEREARNASLGLAGERFVLSFEHARLIACGREALADRIEHVPTTMGDGAGFDIRSFEPDGSDRFIEVKTTAYGERTPFFLSINELETSRTHDSRYHLYRVFGFRADPRLFTMAGSLDRLSRLDPVQFRARI